MVYLFKFKANKFIQQKKRKVDIDSITLQNNIKCSNFLSDCYKTNSLMREQLNLIIDYDHIIDVIFSSLQHDRYYLEIQKYIPDQSKDFYKIRYDRMKKKVIKFINDSIKSKNRSVVNQKIILVLNNIRNHMIHNTNDDNNKMLLSSKIKEIINLYY